MRSDPGRSGATTRPREFRRVALLATLALTLGVGGAFAQYDATPFEDDPVAVSAAFGAESAVLRLEAAEALLDEGVEEDEIDELLEGLELDRARFGATLRDADADLFDEVEEAFEAIEGARDPAAAVGEALPVAREARDAVSGPFVEDPAHAAAVMTLLLVSESGVAEGWEEAVEGEVGPYAFGWAGMPRLYELWEVVKPEANENQVFEIEDQLGELDALFENPTPPNMDGADPEAGEGAAVHVAGFLEDATGAWLFPDRDLASLASTTREVAARACEAYDAEDTVLGDARMAWVGFAFGEYLAGTLGLFAPEATEELAGLLGPFTGEEEEAEGAEAADPGTAAPDADAVAGGDAAADGDAEADAEPEAGADEDAGADAPDVDVDGDDGGVGFDRASCGALLDAFDEAGAPLGL